LKYCNWLLDTQWFKSAQATIIAEDDVEISRTFHRHVLTPDADLSGEDADVQAIAGTVFTDAAKAAYAAASALE
jgi:hypothetical protein